MNDLEDIDQNQQDDRLTVEATAYCWARSGSLDGRPVLVIDYGGCQLAFTAVDLGDASEFAVGLAHAALNFSSRCKTQLGRHHA